MSFHIDQISIIREGGGSELTQLKVHSSGHDSGSVSTSRDDIIVVITMLTTPKTTIHCIPK